MYAKTVIRVDSDNYSNALFSFEAYRELRLQMSTGDFHSHSYEILEVPSETEVIELDQLVNEEA